MRRAVGDLGWLLSRGYATKSALALVGDRFRLRERQRTAVLRASCTADQRAARLSRQLEPSRLVELEGLPLSIDGFNVLTTVESALAGAMVMRCVDGCRRDMASMHGSYRRVAETGPAVHRVADALAAVGGPKSHWLLDRPVSNSGRLASTIRAIAADRGLDWTVELVPDPDPVLIAYAGPIATADSGILDGCGAWVDLAGLAVDAVPDVWEIDLAVSAPVC